MEYPSAAALGLELWKETYMTRTSVHTSAKCENCAAKFHLTRNHRYNHIAKTSQHSY